MKKTILLYYKYVTIKDTEAIAAWQRELAGSLDLLGRIIIAPEGINGTIAGFTEKTDQYIKAMNQHELFHDMPFKKSLGYAEYNYFERLSVKVKNEIVNFGPKAAHALPDDRGSYLTPEEAHQLLSSKNDDLVIFDGRNAHEAEIGRFEGAVIPTVRYSREFPDYFDNNEELFKDKKVFMYCTGGVRCERLSAYLKQKNIAQEVYHLKGGIHEYVQKFPDGHFRGKNYVFDQRIAVPVTDDVLGQCYHCKSACDDFTNCASTLCNKHFISCLNCLEKTENCCSESCQEAIRSGRARKRAYVVKAAVYKEEEQAAY